MNDAAPSGSSPRRIRQHNVVAALQTLHKHGCMSRAGLARKLGLNRSSSGQIVTQLTGSGLVRDIEAPVSRREEGARAGRPGILLDLVPDAAFFVGIEIGVEHISTVHIDLCGRVTLSRTTPFDSKSTTAEDAVGLAFRLAFEAVSETAMSICKGVGLSAPAHIASNGIVSIAPLMGWRNVDLARIARALLPAGIPVIVENDANALAIGDGYKHGRSGVTLFLLMETGVGGGILIDGKLFRGGHGLAGEIGHTRMPGNDGKELEQLIGREPLLRRYRASTGNESLGFPSFLADVRDRVPVAVAIAEDWSKNLAFALVQACRFIDPDRIVFGGSVAALYPLVAARVAAHMSDGQTIAYPKPVMVFDDNAEHGSAFGAACLLHQRFMSLDNQDFAGDDNQLPRVFAPEDAVITNNESEHQ